MVDVVDSIVAELEVRLGNYVSNFEKATSAADKHTAALKRLVAADKATGVMTSAPKTSGAAALNAAAAAAGQSADRRKRAAKGASDAETAAAEAVKKAARESEAAQKKAARDAEAVVKASARARAQAEKQAEREIEQAQRRYYAQGPKVFEAKAREFSAVDRQKDIAAAQASAAALVKAEREKQAAAKATAREEAAAAKAAEARAVVERDAAAAIAAAAERETAARARLSAVADRAVGRRASQIAPAVNSSIGATVPREATGQRGIPSGVLAGSVIAEVEAEKEINHLLADQFDLQQRVKAAHGATKREMSDEVEYLRRIAAYKRAGLAEDVAVLRAESEIVAIQKLRADGDRRQSLRSSAAGLARGAGFAGFASGGAAAAIGMGVAIAGIAGIVAATEAGLKYSLTLKALSDQLGVTTRTLQVFQTAGDRVGVTNEALRESLAQVSSNLGRAQQGSEEQAKIFARLNIDIGNAKDGYKNLGDVLPTLADRLSKITSLSQRNAIETALGGEQLAKLDPILSKGSAGLDNLSDSLERTGAILSDSQIQHAAKVAADLKRIGDQLQRSVASTVSQNADAILVLANSFQVLANKALGAIAVLQRFGAGVIANGDTPFASDQSRALGRSFLNQSKDGRVANRQRIARARDDVNALDGSGGSVIIAGLGSVENTREGKAKARTALQAQRREVRTAVDLDRVIQPEAQTGSPGDTSNLFAPKPPKGPKGKSADTLANEEDQRKKRNNDLLARYEDERLQAVAEQTSDENTRRDLQRQQLERDTKREIEDLKLQAGIEIRRGANKDLVNADLVRAIAAKEAAAGEQQQVINLDDLLSALKRRTQAANDILDYSDQLLRDEEAVATTVEQRRKIELKILENARQRESNGANLVLSRAENGDPSITDEDIQSARTTLKTQPARVASQTNTIDAAHESPLDAYRRQLHEATDDTNAALQQVEVAGLQRLEDQVSSSIGKVLGLKGAFGELFSSILADLAKIEIKKAILGFLDAGANGATGGAGGIVTTALNLLGGRASGGNVVGGGNYLVGERGPEIVNFPSSGRVYPNGALPDIAASRGNTTLHQTFHIDASGVNPQGYAEEIISHVERRTAAAIRASSRATLDATPARVHRFSQLGS